MKSLQVLKKYERRFLDIDLLQQVITPTLPLQHFSF